MRVPLEDCVVRRVGRVIPPANEIHFAIHDRYGVRVTDEDVSRRSYLFFFFFLWICMHMQA
jgi:hypothetical protein